MLSRDVAIGSSFLLAIFFYATGSEMVDGVLGTQSEVFQTKTHTSLATGVLLMFGNSVCVICIGSLMYPVLVECNQAIAISYVATRCAEAILLGFGLCSTLAILALDEDNYDTSLPKMLAALKWSSYQLAMLSLSTGSIPTWITAFQHELVPHWLSVWGIIGYTVLLVGSMCEVFGYPYGIPLSIPGGLFEIVLPFWLFCRGFKKDLTLSMEPLVAEVP